MYVLLTVLWKRQQTHTEHFCNLQEAVAAERQRAQAQEEQAAAKQSIQQAQQASCTSLMSRFFADASCALWLAHLPA